MAVRAKFYCMSIERTTHSSIVKMAAVCRGEDNKEWASATPVASLSMTVLNDVAAAQFEPGQEYFLDFTPAPKGEPGMGA